jgi:hypothetical protein
MHGTMNIEKNEVHIVTILFQGVDISNIFPDFKKPVMHYTRECN